MNVNTVKHKEVIEIDGVEYILHENDWTEFVKTYCPTENPQEAIKLITTMMVYSKSGKFG